jgi:xanthine dehydrogenase YagS FAD-binding subunit
MENFEHIDAASIEQALRLSRRKGVKVIAGGTDLLGLLKDNILPQYPEKVVNIKSLPGMDQILENESGLRIGPLVKLSSLVTNVLIKDKYSLISQAAGTVATPEIRNAATIGGNLCQDVRCWYYRYPHQIGGAISCRRKDIHSPCHAITGDNRYHAIMDIGKCVAICPSDLAVALSALGATLQITGGQGSRLIAVDDFYKPLGVGLKAGEIITGIHVPPVRQGNRQKFIKFTLRKPVDFAILSVSAVIAESDGIIRYTSISLGAVAAGPVKAAKAEAIISGKSLDEELAQQAADAQMADARPLSGNVYKIEIAKSLIKRAILG